MGRKLSIDPRQIEHRCNRAHLVIVRHHLFKAERIKQLPLIPLQPPHHPPLPPLTASTQGIIVRGSLQRTSATKSARSRQSGTSAIRSLSGGKRTLHGKPISVAIDPSA